MDLYMSVTEVELLIYTGATANIIYLHLLQQKFPSVIADIQPSDSSFFAAGQHNFLLREIYDYSSFFCYNFCKNILSNFTQPFVKGKNKIISSECFQPNPDPTSTPTQPKPNLTLPFWFSTMFNFIC